MAVTAKFQADFSSFSDAVQKAEFELRSFESGAGKVEKSLNKMADALSGRKLIQDVSLSVEAVQRLGGVSKLTESELAALSGKAAEAAEKLKAMGIDVPPGIAKIAAESKTATTTLDTMKGIATSLLGAFGIAFSVGAVVNFGKELFTTADNLVRVADRTGLTVEQVQRLSYVAAQSGNNLEELTGAIGQMQNRLADPTAQQAIRDLKINFEDLQSANPYRQLQLIADAMSQIPTPAKQAQLAVDLFGKNGIAILPTLKSHFSELAKEVAVASDAEVKAMDAAGDALARLASNAKAHAINIAGSLVIAGESAKNIGLLNVLAMFVDEGAPRTLAALLAVSEAAKKTGKDIELALPKDPLAEYRKHLDETKTSVTTLTAAQQAIILDAIKLGESHSQIAAALNLSTAAVDAFVTAEQEAVDQRIFVEQLAQKWHDLYFDMRMFGVKAIQEYTKEVQAAMAKQREAVQAAQLSLLSLIVGQRKEIDQINGTALTGIDAQMAALQKKYEADIRNIEQLGRAATDAGVGGAEWSTKAQEAADNAYRIYVDGFDKIVQESNRTFGGTVPSAMNSPALSDAASKGASGIFGPFTQAFSSIEGAADAMSAHVASALERAIQLETDAEKNLRRGGIASTIGLLQENAAMRLRNGLPSFANGVRNFAGGTALVGERGPELVNLPKGSSVFPDGGGTGVTVNIGTIVASGPEAGRQAADALLAHLKRRGNRINVS